MPPSNFLILRGDDEEDQATEFSVTGYDEDFNTTDENFQTTDANVDFQTTDADGLAYTIVPQTVSICQCSLKKLIHSY